MTQIFHSMVLLLAGLASMQAMAWENHSLASYRAFENMPEVADAPSATVETLDDFLRSEEYVLEALLASQEAWALANIEKYPVRPGELAFRADPERSDEARRLAFLRALRVAPDSRFALYIQSDLLKPASGAPLPPPVVSTLPVASGSGHKYLALKPGDLVDALAVLATATDEPSLGLDARLFADNPSNRGKRYGFGPQPWGNPQLAEDSQEPFHMGFMHEGRLIALGMPDTQPHLVLMRSYQYSTLAGLAFRTGHAYWGWRFAGLALHYLQDLTQPYRVALLPGESGLKMLSAQVLSAAGMPALRDNLMQLRTNRSQVLEKYLAEMLQDAASKQETALQKALQSMDRDDSYPDWNDRYLRDVVSLQAKGQAPAVTRALVAALPKDHLASASLDLAADLSKRESPERDRLDASLAALMGNFGAHSRNALRGILRASDPL